MRFEWNQEGFNALETHIQDKLPQAAQPVLDDVYERGQGKSVVEIKQLLAVEWKKRFGGELAEPTLSAWAEAVAAGKRVIARTRSDE